MILKELIFLASYGYVGGEVGNILLQWEQLGLFSYLLPFLLIFAVITGILTRTNFFNENKSVNVIIAFTVSLMALQFDFVSVFFSEIFPRVGVGLAIILTVLIVAGFFFDPEASWIMYILFGLGMAIVIVILVQSGIATGSSIAYWIRDNSGLLIGSLIILIILIILVSSSKKSEDFKPYAVRGGQ